MIYITGDCHGEFNKFSTAAFPEQKQMTKKDIVIVCGDFGGIWDTNKNSQHERYWFFGHYHEDRKINDKFILLYDQIIRIL